MVSGRNEPFPNDGDMNKKKEDEHYRDEVVTGTVPVSVF
jgi:hypothetical protein